MLFVSLLVAADQPYVVEAQSGKDKYVFYLNVCGETRAGDCNDGKGSVSSCQVKESSDIKKIAGRFENQTLRLILAHVFNPFKCLSLHQP